MKKNNLIVGFRYWSLKYWRYVYYKGRHGDKFRFEDVAGVTLLLAESDLANLSEYGWRQRSALKRNAQ